MVPQNHGLHIKSDDTENVLFKAMFISILGFPGNSVGKESTCNAGDSSSIPGSGRSSGVEIGYPFQYSWASPLV